MMDTLSQPRGRVGRPAQVSIVSREDVPLAFRVSRRRRRCQGLADALELPRCCRQYRSYQIFFIQAQRLLPRWNISHEVNSRGDLMRRPSTKFHVFPKVSDQRCRCSPRNGIFPFLLRPRHLERCHLHGHVHAERIGRPVRENLHLS